MKLPDPILKVRDNELADWIDITNLVINSGRYEFPIYSAALSTAQINEGESFIVANGTTRQLKIRINDILCTLNFGSDGLITAGGLGDRILDVNGDTAVITEFFSDENIIRFYSNGKYLASLSTAGFSVIAGLPIILEGVGGDTYMVYNSTTGYIQWFLNGSLRMEI